MILLIKINSVPFHYFEFVKPVEDIMRKIKTDFITVHYRDLTEGVLLKTDKIIICGTSLKDNMFLENMDYFRWLKNIDKPVLGICGGMHILGLVFDGELHKGQEIGLNNIKFKKKLLEYIGKHEVYELHKFYTTSKEFEIFAESKVCPQAIKHKNKTIYGLLFHPEVRNKSIIEKFVKLKTKSKDNSN
ncbi:MAG: hypothetical protein JSW62_04475 [Thermoplasmatales archaeon]|nr:MAG: hypothetical protein JSW62_04475 [Thermoplasmatales archaeon]